MMTSVTRQLMLVVFVMGCLIGKGAMASPCTGFLNCANIKPVHTLTKNRINIYTDLMVEYYELWLEKIFWEYGIAPALPKMMTQISVANQKKLEITSTILDAEKHSNAQLVMQKQKYESAKSVLPSEEHCEAVTLSAGNIAARESARANVANSMDFMRQVATSANPVVASPRDYARVTKEHALCRYADRKSAGGKMALVCDSVQPSDEDVERSLIGNLGSKMTFDEEDQQAINAHAQSMMLPNRPANYDPDLLDYDEMQVAHMGHRSVASRELLASYCFMKSYEHKFGGEDSMLSYIQAFLTERGLTVAEIEELLGEKPSLYAQKQILVMLVNNPDFGVSLTDVKENIIRLSNVVKSYSVSTRYDMLESLQCNQMMASQMVLDSLLPKGIAVQQDINSLSISQAAKDNVNVVNAASVDTQSEGL